MTGARGENIHIGTHGVWKDPEGLVLDLAVATADEWTTFPHIYRGTLSGVNGEVNYSQRWSSVSDDVVYV